MSKMNNPQSFIGRTALIALGVVVLASLAAGAAWARPEIQTVPGMAPVVDPDNLYSEAGANLFNPATAGALSRVYVPNRRSN
ncbi:MAG: hypothetical protein ACREFM_14075, partial [Hypericibacter sp.]